MLGEQQAHLRDLRFAEESALNDARFEHNRIMEEKKQEFRKSENIFCRQRFPLPPRPASATIPVRSKTCKVTETIT